ncbi:peptide maturation system acyl carrier-related protein [Peptacetobacter hominis]|uniref:Peptide maturation system acyl carrier-related protein n=1 Tax=Peptacetobacter hominis TaxID=2743610 RepID=A0A544QTM7_9FIRM|nr:peptide maturation system acyl carrier-related protein [Peptacetobacter hominis]TQQ84040.1 peptide maturation system acyl carrier-related protein [Peptacetobacter hominis]
MKYNKDSLEKELNFIMINRSNINFLENPNLKSQNFFSKEINLPPRELVLILIDIQNKLNVTIPEADIINKKFNTFNNILSILERSFDYEKIR